MTTYLERYSNERARLSELLDALADGWSLASRAERRGHVTCGALATVSTFATRPWGSEVVEFAWLARPAAGRGRLDSKLEAVHVRRRG